MSTAMIMSFSNENYLCMSRSTPVAKPLFVSHGHSGASLLANFPVQPECFISGLLPMKTVLLSMVCSS